MIDDGRSPTSADRGDPQSPAGETITLTVRRGDSRETVTVKPDAKVG
jgi:hypothetical protein